MYICWAKEERVGGYLLHISGGVVGDGVHTSGLSGRKSLTGREKIIGVRKQINIGYRVLYKNIIF